jgi:hypothetical protein
MSGYAGTQVLQLATLHKSLRLGVRVSQQQWCRLHYAAVGCVHASCQARRSPEIVHVRVHWHSVVSDQQVHFPHPQLVCTDIAAVLSGSTCSTRSCISCCTQPSQEQQRVQAPDNVCILKAS